MFAIEEEEDENENGRNAHNENLEEDGIINTETDLSSHDDSYFSRESVDKNGSLPKNQYKIRVQKTKEERNSSSAEIISSD